MAAARAQEEVAFEAHDTRMAQVFYILGRCACRWLAGGPSGATLGFAAGERCRLAVRHGWAEAGARASGAASGLGSGAGEEWDDPNQPTKIKAKGNGFMI